MRYVFGGCSQVEQGNVRKLQYNFALGEREFFSARLRAAYTRSATGVPQRRLTPRPMRGSIVATGYTLTLRGR